ncbi:MAG: hypothetical protein ACK4JY_13455 [Brevundimonas sp.]|uniref:hypothetical protein n=1 Tax=Brevundimonas sp. TaxID=1871086 RepID=UPI00391A5F69
MQDHHGVADLDHPAAANGTPPARGDYLLKLFTTGQRPARAERLDVDTMGEAVEVSRSRVSASATFARGMLYCDGAPVMEFTRHAIRWANLH